MSESPDEFAWIASLRPLTLGDGRALGLRDDAAMIPTRPGFDLVVSTDAMVEAVHFLAGEDPRLVARRLLRASLSDLAAKAAQPFGYLLAAAFTRAQGQAWRDAFRDGLAQDGALFEVSLLGGDTVATSGALTLAATVFGWAPAGGAVLRSGARAGDLLVVCGNIGDGLLGLRAARGEIADPGGALASRYRLPSPLLALREPLRAFARAAADVSDGLLADAAHIAEASGLGLTLELRDMPLSIEARAWLSRADDHASATLELSAGGDDYAIACAVDPADEGRFHAAVSSADVPVATLGRFRAEPGETTLFAGRTMTPARTGWRHT